MIDFVLVNNRWRSCVLNTRSFPSADINSDHQLILSNLRLRFAARRHNKQTTKEFRRHAVEKLQDPQILQNFQDEVQNRFAALKSSTLDTDAENFSTVLCEAADKTVGFQKH